MHRTLFLFGAAIGWSGLLLWAPNVSVADEQPTGAERLERVVTFELTYLHRDLVWLGDPASPTTMIYVRPAARPIATDLEVRTISTDDHSPARRYMREARIVATNDTGNGFLGTVLAFTQQREQPIGTIDSKGQFTPAPFYAKHRALLPSWPDDPGTLHFDAAQNALYLELAEAGPVISESLDFLPLALFDTARRPREGRFEISLVPGSEAAPARIELHFRHEGADRVLASAAIPRGLRREDVRLESFDNSQGTYLAEAAYRPGAAIRSGAEPSVTLRVDGQFSAEVNANDPRGLILRSSGQPVNFTPAQGTKRDAPAGIAMDGQFDDWRNVPGVDDPRGDLAPYLEYIPDVDLLEFKLANDADHIYYYARVAGQVGRCHPSDGRSYFYAYMDVDQNATTGFLPSRDDDCYYGVDIGDDCEVQFEFVDNAFRKTFYGFCGLGGDREVLTRQVTLGPSQYGRFDAQGRERAHYKSEYTYRGGQTEITEDLKLGTSDTIRLAISPDGSEVEVVSSLEGFLSDPQGRPTVRPGQTIDVAAGMECDSRAYPGKSRWAADSTPPIRGYRLGTAE